MNYWLMKSEPDVFSFEHLRQRPKKTEPWNGVRNYQARNYMQSMEAGDLAFFYHSSCPEPGIAGVMRVSRAAYPDHTAQDAGSDYHDPKATPENPRWYMVNVTWHAAFPNFVSLEKLKELPGLEGLVVLRRGNRLSITPVDPAHFAIICREGGWLPDGMK